MAFCARPGVAFVFSLEDDGGEEAVLEGGVELLTRVEWVKSGNGNGLLAWSDFGVRDLPTSDFFFFREHSF